MDDALGNTAILSLLLDYLHLRSSLAFLAARRLAPELRPRYLNELELSLWDATGLANMPFRVISAMDMELQRCQEHVRSNPCIHSFHVHYASAPCVLGVNADDRESLSNLGSLRGWRPGDRRPARQGDAAKGISAVPEHTEPGFEIHLFPKSGSKAMHEKATLPWRGSTSPGHRSPPADGFVDHGLYDLVAVRAREPMLMLMNFSSSLFTSRPLFTWLIHAHVRLWGDEPSLFVLGTFAVEGGKGRFKLSSFQGGDSGMPLTCCSVSTPEWSMMSSILRDVHPVPTGTLSDESVLPDCLNIGAEHEDNDARNSFCTPEYEMVQRFHVRFGILVRDLAAPDNATEETLILTEENSEMRYETTDDSGCIWTLERRFVVWNEEEDVSEVLKPALQDARSLFREIMTCKGYADLCAA